MDVISNRIQSTRNTNRWHYHAERHPIDAIVLRNTRAPIVLRRENERTKALRDTIAELLGMDEPRRRFAAMTQP